MASSLASMTDNSIGFVTPSIVRSKQNALPKLRLVATQSKYSRDFSRSTPKIRSALPM